MPSIVARLAPFSVAAALAVPAMLSFTGCKPPPYPQCKKDKHCKVNLGEKCVDGKCQNCTTDADCATKAPPDAPTPWVCADFRCQDPATLEGATTEGAGDGKGEPCAQTGDCINGWVCREGVCDACVDDIECEGGSCDFSTGQCVVAGAGGGTCQTDDECQMDEICDNGTCVFSDVTGGTDPCGLKAVFFDFDSPKIKPDAAEQLKGLAECMQQQGRLVYLEAHADPRGTEEYNILLTDKRGQSVKKFLQDLGVTGDNMQVISKGSLEATGTSEAEWSQDRRVEFIWPN